MVGQRSALSMSNLISHLAAAAMEYALLLQTRTCAGLTPTFTFSLVGLTRSSHKRQSVWTRIALAWPKHFNRSGRAMAGGNEVSFRGRRHPFRCILHHSPMKVAKRWLLANPRSTSWHNRCIGPLEEVVGGSIVRLSRLTAGHRRSLIQWKIVQSRLERSV